jgi:DNA adenine methylase
MNEQVSRWLSAIDGLPEAHARLQRVVIMCKDALRVIASEDSSSTFYYLDPPYLQATRQTQGTYAHEMTSDDHLKLLQALGTIKGKFLLSGYPSSLYDTYAEKFGWCKREIKIDNKARAKKVKEIKTECLWANYDLPLEIAPLTRLIQQEFQDIQGVDC